MSKIAAHASAGGPAGGKKSSDLSPGQPTSSYTRRLDFEELVPGDERVERLVKSIEHANDLLRRERGREIREARHVREVNSNFV